jgi:hypothetical protein
MADNGWMYSGRISATEKIAKWVSKTDLLVKELARGSKSGVIRLQRIYNFLCSMLIFTPFA